MSNRWQIDARLTLLISGYLNLKLKYFTILGTYSICLWEVCCNLKKLQYCIMLKCQTSFIPYILKQPIYQFGSLTYGLENMLCCITCTTSDVRQAFTKMTIKGSKLQPQFIIISFTCSGHYFSLWVLKNHSFHFLSWILNSTLKDKVPLNWVVVILVIDQMESDVVRLCNKIY